MKVMEVSLDRRAHLLEVLEASTGHSCVGVGGGLGDLGLTK